jgi:acetoacetyl-CoA synthetase
MVANVPEAIVAALGSAAIGAVWSSCSPDFGVQGVIDRFGQIRPSCCSGSTVINAAGSNFDCLEKLDEVVLRLPTVPHDRDSVAGTGSAMSGPLV